MCRVVRHTPVRASVARVHFFGGLLVWVVRFALRPAPGWMRLIVHGPRERPLLILAQRAVLGESNVGAHGRCE